MPTITLPQANGALAPYTLGPASTYPLTSQPVSVPASIARPHLGTVSA